MLIKRKLSLLVPNLLSRDGKELVTGGLERYVWQLLALARQMAFSVDVHQYGDSDWEKEVDGIKIKGYGLAALSPEAALQEMHFNTRRVLYASILLNPVSYKPGAAAISHGVWWDGGNAAEDYICAMFKLCRRALQEAETVVSCDYNFLNVMRAAYPLLASKIKVIPNYADPEFFGPPLKVVRDTINILYPRRLDYCRGVDLFLEAGREILAAFPQARLHLAVDRNRPHLNSQLEEWVAGQEQAQRERIVCATYSFTEMAVVYRAADIVVIPSRFSEGTSFSCLEAMASGCAVISTDVGGLTNLIIDDYNGLLVQPTVEGLSAALERLLSDSCVLQRLRERAQQTAFAFSLQKWQQHWAEILQKTYG